MRYIFLILLFAGLKLSAQVMQIIPDKARVWVTLPQVSGTKNVSVNGLSSPYTGWPWLIDQDKTTSLDTEFPLQENSYTGDTVYVVYPNKHFVNHFNEDGGTTRERVYFYDCFLLQDALFTGSQARLVEGIYFPEQSYKSIKVQVGTTAGSYYMQSDTLDLRNLTTLGDSLIIRCWSVGVQDLTTIFLPDSAEGGDFKEITITYAREDTIDIRKYRAEGVLEITNPQATNMYIYPPLHGTGNFTLFDISGNVYLQNDLDLTGVTEYLGGVVNLDANGNTPTKKLLFDGTVTNNNVITTFDMGGGRWKDTIDLRAFKNITAQIQLDANPNIEHVLWPTGATAFGGVNFTTGNGVDSMDFSVIGDNVITGSFLLTGVNVKSIIFPASNIAPINVVHSGTQVDTLDLSGLTGLGTATYSLSNGVTSISASTYQKRIIFPASDNYVQVTLSDLTTMDTIDITPLNKCVKLDLDDMLGLDRLIFDEASDFDYMVNFTVTDCGDTWNDDDTLDLSRLNFTSIAADMTIEIGNQDQLKRIILPPINGNLIENFHLFDMPNIDTLDFANVTANKVEETAHFDLAGVTRVENMFSSTRNIRNLRFLTDADTIDISGLTNLGNSGYFEFQSYTPGNLKKIIMPSSNSSTSQFYQAFIINTGIDTLDFTVFNRLTGRMDISDNSSLVKIKFNPTIISTVTKSHLEFNDNDLDSLDISMLTYLGNSFVSGSILDVSGNSNLNYISLPTANGHLATYDLSSCDLEYVDFTSLSQMTNGNSRQFLLQDNSMTAAEVNHILVDLDGLSSGGYTGRVINIAGTNAAPDGSSGGYDGLTAKSNLQTKGFTVTTN